MTTRLRRGSTLLAPGCNATATAPVRITFGSDSEFASAVSA